MQLAGPAENPVSVHPFPKEHMLGRDVIIPEDVDQVIAGRQEVVLDDRWHVSAARFEARQRRQAAGYFIQEVGFRRDTMHAQVAFQVMLQHIQRMRLLKFDRLQLVPALSFNFGLVERLEL